MPFTLAHPALVLPFLKLNRRYISATGLVTGSIAPDFEYFFKLSVNGKYGHTILGIFYFSMPVALFLSLVFHLVVKRNLICNLPYFFQRRLGALLRLDFLSSLRKYPAAFLVSAALGAASHIFWDGFTHKNTLFVQNLEFYKDAYVSFYGVKYPLWYALQHISTWVGVILIIFYIAFMERDKYTSVYKPVFLYWLALFVMAAAIVAVRFLIRSSDYQIGNLIVTCISGLCISLIICGLINFRNDLLIR